MISNSGVEAESILVETPPFFDLFRDVPPQCDDETITARRVEEQKHAQKQQHGKKAGHGGSDDSIDTKVEKNKEGDNDPIAKIAAKLHKRFRVKEPVAYKPKEATSTAAPLYFQTLHSNVPMPDYSKLFSYLGTRTAEHVYQAHYTSGEAHARQTQEESLTWQQFDEVTKKAIYNDKLGFMDTIDPYEREKAQLVKQLLDVGTQMTRQLLAGTVRIG